MVDYKIVKICRFCEKKFVTGKSGYKQIYCGECQAKMNKE